MTRNDDELNGLKYLKHEPGFVIKEKRGVNGFGYDPYFIPKYNNKTFAEMEKSQKLLNSHRYKAFEKLSTQILQDN